MTNNNELIFRLLAIIAGASITTLNLVIGHTLLGRDREKMRAYSKGLHDEFVEVANELGAEI